MINIIADSDIPNLDEYLKITIDENLFNINFLNFKKINPKTIKACEVLLVRSTTKVDKSLLQDSNIKFVGSATAGINHLDTNYLNANNIKWNYSPCIHNPSQIFLHYYISFTLFTLTSSNTIFAKLSSSWQFI